MAVPVLILSALTLLIGWLGPWLFARLDPTAMHESPLHIGAGALTALGLAAAGIALAWVEFGARNAARVGFVDRLPALRHFFANNWYVDRLYDATVVRAAGALARAARWNDQQVLDGAADGVAAGTVRGGRLLALLQSGQVQAYLAIGLAAVAALALWVARAAVPG